MQFLRPPFLNILQNLEKIGQGKKELITDMFMPERQTT